MRKGGYRPGLQISPGPSPVGRIWPNGKFGIGWRVGGDREETEFEECRHQDKSYWFELPATDSSPRGGSRGAELGLSNVHYCHSEANDVPDSSPRRGEKGITSYGRNMVESACILLEKKYGRKNIGFGTVTCPTMTEEEAWAISARWADIKRVFFQRLKRDIEKKGGEFVYVSVTENQVRRSADGGFPCLHLHFAYPCRHKNRYHFTPGEVRRHWSAALGNVIDSNRDWSAVENLQVIKKSCSSYLGKYLSKGAGDIEGLKNNNPLGILPAQWWGMSRSLSRGIKKRILKNGSVLAWVAMMAASYDTSGVFQGVFEVTIGNGEGYRLVGLAGKLAPAFLESLHRSVGIMT